MVDHRTELEPGAMLRTATAFLFSLCILCAGCGDGAEVEARFPTRELLTGEKIPLCNALSNPELTDEDLLDGLVDLTEAGDTRLVRRVLKCREPASRRQLADDLAVVFIDERHLGSDGGEAQLLASDVLFMILPMLEPVRRDETQRALAAWASSGLDAVMTREDVWEVLRERLGLKQIPSLGAHGIELALLMVQKRLETREVRIADWLRFLGAFEDPGIEERTMEALRTSFDEVYSEMAAGSEDAYFPLYHIVATAETVRPGLAVPFLLDIADREEVLDRRIRLDSLLAARALFFDTLSPEERGVCMYRLFATELRFLPLLCAEKRAKLIAEFLALASTDGPAAIAGGLTSWFWGE